MYYVYARFLPPSFFHHIADYMLYEYRKYYFYCSFPPFLVNRQKAKRLLLPEIEFVQMVGKTINKIVQDIQIVHLYENFVVVYVELNQSIGTRVVDVRMFEYF